MGKETLAATLFALVAATAAPAWSEDKQEPRPQALSRLIDCRAITDPAARLACYDTQVAALDKAEQDREVVIVDRSQIRKARRSLFGLDLPDFSLFGRGDKSGKNPPEEEGVTKIETAIARAFQGADNRWVLILQDGARWVQVDNRDVPRSPKGGMPIAIRRAAMGSFLANIDKQIAIRVRRINGAN